MLNYTENTRMGNMLEKAVAGERPGRAELTELLRSQRIPIGELAQAADAINTRLHPENIVTYIVDRNINYTNLCDSGCKFCAFYVPAGKGSANKESFVISQAEIEAKILELKAAGGRQVLLQGGLNPELGMDYYVKLLEFIKGMDIHIHGFSPPEIIYLATREGISVAKTIERLVSAGLDSIPGGGAEILVDAIRKKISPNKCSAGEWLDVMRTAHGLGLKTTATMMFGHVESMEDRVDHLIALRELQDETGGFTAFIPWPFQPGNTALVNLTRNTAGSVDYLRTLAVSRIALDNFPNLQASWVTQGRKIAQIALFFGANDMGSTMLEENVVRAAGVTYRMNESEIRKTIEDAGKIPKRRNMSYELLE